MSVSGSEYDRELTAVEGVDGVDRSVAEPTADNATPPRVLVSGGEPLALGLMAFALGTLVVGMALVGVFPASVLGCLVPAVLGMAQREHDLSRHVEGPPAGKDPRAVMSAFAVDAWPRLRHAGSASALRLPLQRAIVGYN